MEASLLAELTPIRVPETPSVANAGRSNHCRLAPRNRVAELEGEVPCNAEAVGDPLACEPLDDVIRDSWLR